MRPTWYTGGRQPTLLSLLIQMLTSARNTLTDISRELFNQISEHPVTWSGWPIKLTITKYQGQQWKERKKKYKKPQKDKREWNRKSGFPGWKPSTFLPPLPELPVNTHHGTNLWSPFGKPKRLSQGTKIKAYQMAFRISSKEPVGCEVTYLHIWIQSYWPSWAAQESCPPQLSHAKLTLCFSVKCKHMKWITFHYICKALGHRCSLWPKKKASFQCFNVFIYCSLSLKVWT